ncbi:MAG: L-ribulose-5-phosphate 4-epimerase [Clostridia bacterium]
MSELKQRVYEANLELVRRGLVIYTWGNVSAIDREKGIVVIKPRGIEYDELTADDMSVVDLDGNIVDGKMLPSVDLDYHLLMYKAFEGIGGIAHTHSTWATSWAQAQRSIPVIGTTHADHFYGEIPCTRQLTPEEIQTDYEENAGRVIVETFIEKQIDPMRVFGVLCAGHGPFTWGSTPELAVENSVILEEIAHLAKISLDLNPKLELLPDYLLDKHFLRKHGANSYFYQSKNS